MNSARAKYGSNAPEIELITGYVNDVAALYQECQIIFHPAHCEGFGLVPLEGIFAGRVSICSRYSGPIDFLNDEISLLVSGRIASAPLNHQYWEGNVKNTHFLPDMSDMIDKLRFAAANHETLNEKVKAYRETIRDKYSWDTIAKQITSLCR
jgi:glycosyltransferase involved in cell wall biosynthesis